MKKIILALVCVSFFACANSKKVTQEKAATQTEVADKKQRFTVSFISIGSGLDSKARNNYDQFIGEFAKKNKIQLNVEKVNWGKEGENDYCFDLNNLKKSLQEKFIAETKAQLKESKLVRFNFNTTCREARK